VADFSVVDISSVGCTSLFDVGNVKSGLQAVFRRREHHLRRYKFRLITDVYKFIDRCNELLEKKFSSL
jgi:hypothetical protein